MHRCLVCPGNQNELSGGSLVSMTLCWDHIKGPKISISPLLFLPWVSYHLGISFLILSLPPFFIDSFGSTARAGGVCHCRRPVQFARVRLSRCVFSFFLFYRRWQEKKTKQSILPIVFFSWGKNYFQFTLILLFAIFFSVCLAKVFVDLKSPTAWSFLFPKSAKIWRT